jgi:hypothetical protein
MAPMLVGRESVLDCTEVGPNCPVEDTIYGFRPNFAANLIFCLIFNVCCMTQTYQMFRWKMWSFGSVLILGCSSEVFGTYNRLLAW